MAMNRNFYEKPASDGPLDEAQDNGESASGALLDRARPSRPVKATRVDDAYSRLKREILADRFRPGFQAFELEIADMLQMSRTPVREALIRLESDGLIELVPRRGVRVLPVSPGDMKDIYQLLTLLEPEAAAEVAQRGVSADEMASLEQCCTAMQAALEQDDLEGWAEADDQFHRELLAMSSNRRMVEYLNILFDQRSSGHSGCHCGRRRRQGTPGFPGAPRASLARTIETAGDVAAFQPLTLIRDQGESPWKNFKLH